MADYSIGNVSTLTGLTTHTLRKWEDRYKVVNPQRSLGGSRRYTDNQVNKLKLLKTLVDQGYSISKIASHSVESLQEILSEQLNGDVLSSLEKFNIGVLGSSLAVLLAGQQLQMPNLHFIPISDAKNDVNNKDIDALILEQSLLDHSSMNFIEELKNETGIEKLVILYSYAPVSVASKISSHDIACIRMPINYPELQRTISALTHGITRKASKITPQKFTQETLAVITTRSTSVQCECPTHVVDLLVALTNFEKYSNECESKNEDDAQIHRFLMDTASRSRVAFENALEVVANHENIVIPSSE